MDGVVYPEVELEMPEFAFLASPEEILEVRQMDEHYDRLRAIEMER